MMQQINLYQIEERPEPVFFTFMNMLYIAIAFIGVLLLITILKFITNYHAQQTLENLQQQKVSLYKSLHQAQGQMPAKEEKEQLTAQIRDLEISADNMKKMQTTLKQLQYVDGRGFSGFLKGLAKYNVPELWFTEIKISTSGDAIQLAGQTINPENVPQLLQKLSLDSNFAGKTFDAIKIYKIPKEKYIFFRIGSK